MEVFNLTEETFGEAIKEARIRRKISLRELARRIGISHPYLSQLENNHNNNPSLEIIVKLSNELGISLHHLISLSNINLEDYKFTINNDVLGLLNQTNNRDLSNLLSLEKDLKESIERISNMESIGNDDWNKSMIVRLSEILNELPEKIIASQKLEKEFTDIVSSKVEVTNKHNNKNHTLEITIPAYKVEKINDATLTSYIPPDKALESFFDIEKLFKQDKISLNYKGRKLTDNDLIKILAKIEEIKDQFEYQD